MSVPRVAGLSPAGVQAQLANRLVPLVPAASPPVSGSAVTSGTADYGSWVELNAATAQEWHGFQVFGTAASALHTAGANTPCLLDIGVGAPPEVAVVSGADISNRDTQSLRPLLLDVPYLFIPKGSRVAARISSSTTSQIVTLAINGYRPSQAALARPIRKAHAFVTPASQRGVAVAAGTGWTEVVASTPLAVEGLVLGIGSNDNNTAATSGRQFDLAFGASGVETQVWSVMVAFTSSEQLIVTSSTFAPLRVPAGTRISARCQTENMSLTIHGLS